MNAAECYDFLEARPFVKHVQIKQKQNDIYIICTIPFKLDIQHAVIHSTMVTATNNNPYALSTIYIGNSRDFLYFAGAIREQLISFLIQDQ